MSSDINVLLYRIKENIRLVEAGSRDKLVLDSICSDYLDLIELLKLFLISERDSYYGYFLMNMQFKANVYGTSIAGIKLNSFPPIFEANPLLLCKYTLKEILYIVCHEIDHVVLNHPAEMVKANPSGDPDRFYEFNVAADASVNDRINYEIETEGKDFLMQPDGIITSDVLRKMYGLARVHKMESYAYYYELIKGEERKGNNSSSGDGDPYVQNGEIEAGNSETYGDEPTVITAENCKGKLKDHDWEAGEDEDDAAAVVREFVNSATDMMSEEARGLMPAYFISQVEKLNEPAKLSWQKILKKYVGTITANKRKTRTRLNRRQPDRFDLSGSLDDKVLKIVVAIDTSASVSDAMIAKIFNEIFEILAKRKHDITVIECDSEVQRVYKARTQNDIQMKVAGRGGTWFSPVIEHINNDRYFRDALLIYFTDGYGEAEIPKPRTYRNIWVVLGDARNLSLDEPYGAVLSM